VLATLVLSSRSALDTTIRRALAALAALAIALGVLIANPSWWLSFPRLLQTIQFPFRLSPYLALTACMGVAVLLSTAPARRSRLLMGSLIAAVAWQSALAAYQALSARARSLPPSPTLTHQDVTAARPPPSFVGPGYFQPDAFKLTPRDPLPRPDAEASASAGEGTPSTVGLSGEEETGTLIATHVVDSPLIRIDGDAHRAGIDQSSYVVLRVDDHIHSRWYATARPACATCLRAVFGDAPPALLAGRLLSLIGLVGLIVLPKALRLVFRK
jgi:hypothetical protein